MVVVCIVNDTYYIHVCFKMCFYLLFSGRVSAAKEEPSRCPEPGGGGFRGAGLQADDSGGDQRAVRLQTRGCPSSDGRDWAVQGKPSPVLPEPKIEGDWKSRHTNTNTHTHNFSFTTEIEQQFLLGIGHVGFHSADTTLKFMKVTYLFFKKDVNVTLVIGVIPPSLILKEIKEIKPSSRICC